MITPAEYKERLNRLNIKHMQDQPLVKEKVRRDTNTVFYQRFEKKSIEDKESIIAYLNTVLAEHKAAEIPKAQALIDKLNGGQKKEKQGDVNKPNDY